MRPKLPKWELRGQVRSSGYKHQLWGPGECEPRLPTSQSQLLNSQDYWEDCAKQWIGSVSTDIEDGLNTCRYYCYDCAFWDALDFPVIHTCLSITCQALGTKGAGRAHSLVVSKRSHSYWAPNSSRHLGVLPLSARHSHLQIRTLRHREVSYFFQGHSVTKTEIRPRSFWFESPNIRLSLSPHTVSQDSRRHISLGLKKSFFYAPVLLKDMPLLLLRITYPQ